MGGGGGSSNVFATDITVNGLTVGKGDGNVSTNTAFGVDALGSPYIISSNINNTAIGYNALNTIGAGVATLTNLVGGSYTGDDGVYQIQLEYAGVGTPVIAGGQYPNIFVELSGGEVINVVEITDAGYGFVNNSTVMTYTGGALGTGSGFSIKADTLKSASNNVAIGYNLGTTNKTASNQILIGSNITSALDNQTIIGNAQTQKATIRGSLNAVGFDNEPIVIGTATGIGDITIGALQPTTNNVITIGRSTLGETVNVGVGEISSDSKIVNIGTGATGGGTEINVGTDSASNVIRIGGGTEPETIDILNSNSSKIINIAATTLAGALDTSVITIGEGNKTSITLNGAITAGGTTGTGTLTFGRSTGVQTVGIATGANNISAKTVNIGTGATNGATTITLGPTGNVTGATTINIGTQARTSGNTSLNIGTNATGGTTTIILGSSGAASFINSNGIVQQRSYTNINLQTATAGRKAFVSDHRSATAYPSFGEPYSISGTFGPFNVPVFADGTIWRVG